MDADKLNDLAVYLNDLLDEDDYPSDVITDLEFTVEELTLFLNSVYDQIRERDDVIED